MTSVFDSGGRQVFDQPVDREQLISPAVAFQMTSMLRDVIGARHRRFRAPSAFAPLAGKTGTTDDYHDAWFVGYSTSVVVGVWGRLRSAASIGRAATVPASRSDLGRLHEADGPPAAGRRVPPCLRLHSEELCSVWRTWRQSMAVRSTRKSSRTAIPCRRRCVPSIKFPQAAASRAIDGFLRGLGVRSRASSVGGTRAEDG